MRHRDATHQAGASLACLAIVAALIAASPICALAWSWGTDSAEMANRIASLLDVKPGDTIAEIGGGHGYMAVQMAEKVGPGGHLYVTEIDPDELKEISKRAADAELANLTVVKATDTETGLEADCCHAVYMTDVYHHFADPLATDKSIFKALKPGGRLFIADFYPTWLFSFWTTPAMRRNFGGHGVAEPLLVSQLTSVGFKTVEEIEGYPSKWPSTSYSVVMQEPQNAAKLMEGERIIFAHEVEPEHGVRIVASGAVDEELIDAVGGSATWWLERLKPQRGRVPRCA